MFAGELNGKLWFCTNSTKDVYKDMQENPEIEISVSSPEYAWIRLHGKAAPGNPPPRGAAFESQHVFSKAIMERKSRKPLFPKASGAAYGTPNWIRTNDLPLRSMAYHVIHGSDVTSNIIPYAE